MITETDKRRFSKDGYLLVENVVPESLCAAVRSTICEFLDMQADDPASWPESQSRGHGIVPIHHPQALWDVRQHPAVHQVFAALHDTEKLWVVVDRVSFKTRDRDSPPPGPAEPIHWDRHPGDDGGLSLQGLVYLTDTAPDQGAFCCAPALYRDLNGYLARHPEHGHSRQPVVDPESIEVVGGPAGSLLVWNRKLPHSSTYNRCGQPRWVQYVAMDPAGDDAARANRVTEFHDRMPPQWAIVQNVTGQKVPEPGGPVRLSALGRKLVGIEVW